MVVTLLSACPRTLLAFQGTEGKKSFHEHYNILSSCCHCFNRKNIKHGIARLYLTCLLDQLPVLRYVAAGEVSVLQLQRLNVCKWPRSLWKGRITCSHDEMFGNSLKVNATLGTRFVNGFSEVFHLSRY